MSKTVPAKSTATTWRTAGVVLFCVAAFLLLSMGGAIIAAPLTVPLMFVITRRHPTPVFRATGALLAGATVAEVVWALTYIVANEARPWIWLAPLVVAVLAMAAIVATSGHARAREGGCRPSLMGRT
jgi:hypothetical protein